MKSLVALMRLELYFSLKRSGFFVYYAILAGMLFLMANVLGGAFPDVQPGGDGLKLNSPQAVQGLMSVVSLITTFVVSSFAGMGALRDYCYGSHQITFSYPVTPVEYVLGKFLGIYFTNLLLFTAPLLGFATGCAMPWLSAGVFVPFDLSTYISAFIGVFALNIFFLTAIFFALSLLVRNIIINWTAIIAFYVMYFLATHYFSQAHTRVLAALLDPYGIIGGQSQKVGQSVEERNTLKAAARGLYLWNRLIWLGIGILSIMIAVGRFRFRQYAADGVARRKQTRRPLPAPIAQQLLPLPSFGCGFGGGYVLRIYAEQLALECRQLLRSIYLYIILLAAVVFLYLGSSVLNSDFQSAIHPITRVMLETFGSIIDIFVLLIILVFSGEAVWRGFQHRMSDIVQSTPAAKSVIFLAKTTALYLVVVIVLALVMTAGIVYQISHHFYQYEFSLYFRYLAGYLGTRYLFYCVLAVALQMLVRNRYQGYAAFAVLYLFSRFLADPVFRHGIFSPGYMPDVTYSDLVGFNGSFYTYFIYFFYWSLFALLILRAGVKAFPLLETESYRSRWQRLRGSGLFKRSAGTWGMAMAMIMLGCYIFYNTDILNSNLSTAQLNRMRAAYEKQYGKLRTVPQPSIWRVEGDIALAPSRREMQADMKLTLVNKNSGPVREVYLNLPDEQALQALSCSVGWTLLFSDRDSRFVGYRLSHALQPGDSFVLSYHFTSKPKGFTDKGLNSLVRQNGTFLNSADFLPVIGYDESSELTGNTLREKNGLPHKPYSARMNDSVAVLQNLFGPGADRVWLGLTISTDGGQTAIAPGYLQRQWVAGGRAYFRYEMDQPAVNYFSIQSGRYSLRTERFIVPGDSLQRPVQLSIYYHEKHRYNLDAMMQAMKDGITYYTSAFGPYQYRQLRIVEFPSDAFAQSFANTIPFSENIGFLTDVQASANEEPERIKTTLGTEEESGRDNNFPYFITLHETAHQWWGHQIVPAATEGAQFLSEAMSQYSAAMALKKKYGVAAVRKLTEYYSFQYLNVRGGERLEERPLERVLMTQQYVFYNKGICALYALQKYIGEDRMNNVLRDFVSANAAKERPYVTAGTLVNQLKASAPDSVKYLVSDCLQHIVLYDNQLKEATYKLDLETLEYAVDIIIVGRKLVYDVKGQAKEVPMNDYVELGILNGDDRQVGSQTVKLHAGENKLHFTTLHRPASLRLNPDFDLLEKKYNKADRTIKVVKL